MHPRIPFFSLILALGLASPLIAQPRSPVYVDDHGVLRWSETEQEVALFGANYSTPFAYAYRAHERLGIDHEAAIDADVAHMARLGFKAFRVHVWDREVSDEEGNLIENEHLRLLDYLIARLQERGIYTMLTPIAWWGTGWPEPDPPTPGFSSNFSKAEMSVDPVSRAAQKTYLAQFLQHVNPYTGLSYRDDPHIIAIELFNEPAHLEPPQETTQYVNELVEVVRGTGFNKPIFYNVSQNWSREHAAAVAAANVQGVSFQWYPTGLVRDATLPGNYLPNVDHYPIPGEGIAGFDRLARMVYEFDAADIAETYIYPAMVRSFREAGMQWATHFSYDPLALAHANTEYGTHYVNLVYTPGKAISLMIAAEAFQQLPRRASYGDFPENVRFGPVRVSYEERLSEWVTEEHFFYSNDTPTTPPAPDRLRRIAGVGTSPLVHYEGTGAYFLDRLDDGVWRLEVYPDAVWVEDPYGPTSPDRPVSRLFWRTHAMRLLLPDLGASFQLTPLNEGDRRKAAAADGLVRIEPGVYLLTRAGVDVPPPESMTSPTAVRLSEYYVPTRSTGPARVVHEPTRSIPAGAPFVLDATIASEEVPDSVWLAIRRPGWRGFARMEMQPVAPYRYQAVLSGPWQNEGPVEYFITVRQGNGHRTFPGDLSQRPGQWDFVGGPGWQTLIADPGAPTNLFRASTDAVSVIYPHQERGTAYEASVVTGTSSADAAIEVRTNDLDRPPHYLAVGIPVTVPVDAAERQHLALVLRSLNASLDSLAVTLVLDDGTSWGGRVPACSSWCTVELDLSALSPTPAVALPRAYPFFLPFWLNPVPTNASAPDMSRLQSIQIGIDARTRVELRERNVGFALQEIMLR